MKRTGYLCLGFLLILNAYSTSGQATSSSLAKGQTLKLDESITSPDGSYSARLRSDGDFVVLKNGEKVWETGTTGKGDRITMQDDGNLVIYKGDNPTWASGTKDKDGVRLDIQDDGRLVIYNSQNQPIWSTNSLRIGQTLLIGQSILSANGKYKAGMLPGRTGFYTLRVMQGGLEIWSAGDDNYGVRITFQPDGNLVIYSPYGPQWSSRTTDKGGIRLDMQDDGNLVIYDINYKSVWESKTKQP